MLLDSIWATYEPWTRTSFKNFSTKNLMFFGRVSEISSNFENNISEGKFFVFSMSLVFANPISPRVAVSWHSADPWFGFTVIKNSLSVSKGFFLKPSWNPAIFVNSLSWYQITKSKCSESKKTLRAGSVSLWYTFFCSTNRRLLLFVWMSTSFH